MRVRHQEYMLSCVASTSVTGKAFKLGSTGLTLLDSLSNAYTRYVIHSLVIEYRPVVGTATDGSIVVAVDWDSSDTAPTEAKLRAMQPQIRGPVWQPGKMALPATRLQYQRNLMISQDTIFTLQYKSTATKDKVCGEIVATYDITMMGPSGN